MLADEVVLDERLLGESRPDPAGPVVDRPAVMDVVVGDTVAFGNEPLVVGSADVDAVARRVEDGVALDAVVPEPYRRPCNGPSAVAALP